MGNCLECLKSESTNPDGHVQETVTESVAGAGVSGIADRCSAIPVVDGDNIERETDELLSSSPLPYTNIGADSHSATLKKSSMLLLNGTANNMSDITGTTVKEHQVSDNTLNALFEEYKDDQEDAILSDGIERLCNDLGYRPDDFAILVLAWRLEASQMCRFTKAEFIQGLQNMRADTIPEIRLRLEEIVDKLRTDSDMFKQLYRFTFIFGLEPGYRTVCLDMAIILWRLVFTVHTPLILDRWLYFLGQHPNIRGMPKDTWNMFLNFAETCDITAYDDTEAWPSLFDDFVEYETDRTNQNVSSSKGASQSTQNQSQADEL